MKFAIILFAILGTVLPERAVAWPTHLYSDAEVVSRAELIVVGHIKPGSIKKSVHVFSGATSYEHHAILVVTRTIKGVLREAELPITIHYGLLPVSARYEKDIYTKPTLPEEPGQATRIFEDNPSEGYFRPTGDVHKDQIWLLHHEGGFFWESAQKTLGVVNPEDIQPTTKEQRLKTILQNP